MSIKNFSCRQPQKNSGFTLVELLMVIGIMLMLTALTTLPLRGLVSSFDLSGAASQVSAEIELARQTSISRNLPVELRIYSNDDDEFDRVATVISSSSSSAATDEWFSNGTKLPQSVMIDGTATFSSILSTTKKSETSDALVPKSIRGLDYYLITFNPDGSTNLDPASGTTWTLTLRNKKISSSETNGGRPANNFVTLCIDPVTGRTSMFRP